MLSFTTYFVIAALEYANVGKANEVWHAGLMHFIFLIYKLMNFRLSVKFRVSVTCIFFPIYRFTNTSALYKFVEPELQGHVGLLF